MSLNSGQIFIATDDFEDLGRELLFYLGEWFEKRYQAIDREADLSTHFLDKDRRRAVMALPPFEGWCTVFEMRPGRADPQLAAHLSRRLGARAVWFELQGARLRWRWQSFDAGRPQSPHLSPERAWTPLKQELFPMPLYEDIEPIAYRQLRELDLPRERLFLRTEDIVVAPDTGSGPALYALMLTSEEGPRFEHLRFEPRWTWRIHDDEPVREDFHGVHHDGERTITLETRWLRGVPDATSASNLVRIERLARERLERDLARRGIDLERHVIDFRYRSEDHDTTLLEALVRQARLELSHRG